jgi:hypothetical protein
MNITPKSNFFIALLLLPITSSVIAQEPSKIDILKKYFSDGSHCSTAKVVEIESIDSALSINLKIEPATRQALLKMSEKHRNDWFSLHCPPEHHAVWANSNSRFDVTIKEAFNPEPNEKAISQRDLRQPPQYNLSCTAYFAEQYSQRLSYSERVKLKIQKLLNP